MAPGSEIRAAAYKTVDVFSSIVGRKIYLSEGSKFQVTDYLIITPFDDANFYQQVEHGISHILFGSNALSRNTFVFQYVDAILTQVRETTGSNVFETDLRTGITYLLGLLETERVTSLWGRMYRGSEMLIRQRRKRETRHLVAQAHKNVLHYATILATDHAAPEGEISWLEPTIREALRRVQYGTFRSTLITTKWLVLQLVDHLVSIAKNEAGNGDEPTADERAAALNQLAKSMASPPSSQKDKVNDFHEAKYKKPGDDDRAHQEALDAINTPVEETGAFEEEIGRERASMDKFMEEVQQRVAQIQQPPNSHITKDAKAKVIFVDILPKDTVAEEGYTLTEQDRASIARMRSFFFRVMGRRRQFLDDVGLVPDIEAVIQRRVSHRPTPVFHAEKPGRGFKALLLLDRSGSMHNDKILQCDRGRKIIRNALEFPFVDVVTWGFNSPAVGTVAMTRFDKDTHSLYAKGNLSRITGGTPLHIAIQLAHQYLDEGSEKKHIFVLTDGMPMFWRWDGYPLTPNAIRRFVRREIDTARRKGIGVTTLLVQDILGFSEPPKQRTLLKMLGPASTWKMLMNEASFSDDLASTVTQSFTEYLRHG